LPSFRFCLFRVTAFHVTVNEHGLCSEYFYLLPASQGF
jgi:hypothetical protein